MDLTLQQIYDFNICPMLYKFKHIMKIERVGLLSMEAEANDAIRKSIMFFYYQILNGKQPTQEQLRQKFGSIFFKNMTVDDILAGSTLDTNFNAVSYQCVKALDSFYTREAGKTFVPIGVDMDVRVPVGDNFVILTIDLIREMKYDDRPLIEVVKFTSSTKKVDTFYANHNLSLTAHAYAFRKLFQATENRLVLQHMRSSKEFFTVRKEPELRRFEAIVNGVADAISKDRFYPVHNAQCNGCLYKDVCDKYKF